MYFLRKNIYGIFIVSLVVFMSTYISKALSANNLLISSAFLCVFIGLLLGNIFSFQEKIAPFIDFSLKKLLRVGIAFLGLSLSLSELLSYGHNLKVHLNLSLTLKKQCQLLTIFLD